MQARAFNRLLRVGMLARHARNGAECYEMAQLDAIRYEIDHPELAEKSDWVGFVLEGLVELVTSKLK